MSRKDNVELIELIFRFAIFSSFLGVKATFNFIKQLLSLANSILVSLYDTTILNIIFKHFFAYPMVGVILMIIRSPKGKAGHWTGKVLYFIVGYVIGFALDFASKLFF